MASTAAQLIRDTHIALRAGRLGEALAAIGRAAAEYPDDVSVLIEQTVVLRAAGQPDKARDIARRATRLAPTSATAHAQLGLCFLDLGKLSSAEPNLQRALQYDRSNADALAGLGRLRLQQNRLAEAEQMLVGAVRARPGESSLYSLLGDVFAARQNSAGMIEAYRRARDIDPLNTLALEKYVAAKQQVGGLDAARSVLEEAVARMPTDAQAHTRLGRFLADHGLLEEAIASFRQALALDPGSAQAAEFLAVVAKIQSVDEPDYLLIAEAYRRTAPETPARASAAFALAKASDDSGNYAAAAAAYVEGNAIFRRGMDFSLDRERKVFSAIAAAFSPELFSRLRGEGHKSRAPIFILGMPRSGTTLTETILSRHPDVYPAGELEFMRSATAGVVGASPVHEAAAFVARLKPKQLQEIGETYLRSVEGAARASPRFTDKMPHNFRLLGSIRLAFPNASIIHVRRDPMDNCLSMFKANFASDTLAFSFDLTELGRYYNLYRRLMAHWRTVLGGTFFEVDYEALVGDPEPTSRALFDYCGLDWSAEVLTIAHDQREVRTASFAQVRSAINTASVNAAARYGDRLDPLRAALAEYED